MLVFKICPSVSHEFFLNYGKLRQGNVLCKSLYICQHMALVIHTMAENQVVEGLVTFPFSLSPLSLHSGEGKGTDFRTLKTLCSLSDTEGNQSITY
jgi:hypothetical protein